jgi:hypothetical protein
MLKNMKTETLHTNFYGLHTQDIISYPTFIDHLSKNQSITNSYFGKIMKVLFSTLLMLFSITALSDQLSALKSEPDPNILTESVNTDYTYWRLKRFNRENICSESFYNILIEDGYSDSNYYNTVNEVLYGRFFRKYRPMDPRDPYLIADSFGLKLLWPVINCADDPISANLYGLSHLTSYVQKTTLDDESTIVEMDSDATYFIGDGGPAIEVYAKFDNTFFWDSLSVKLELLYLSNSGWTVIAQKTIPAQPSSPDQYISAQLPYPALAKFRMTAVPGTVIFPVTGPMSPTSAISIYDISVYTQECVPDLSNPGLCL